MLLTLPIVSAIAASAPFLVSSCIHSVVWPYGGASCITRKRGRLRQFGLSGRLVRHCLSSFPGLQLLSAASSESVSVVSGHSCSLTLSAGRIVLLLFCLVFICSCIACAAPWCVAPRTRFQGSLVSSLVSTLAMMPGIKRPSSSCCHLLCHLPYGFISGQ